MRLTRLFVLCVMLSATIACGGDEGGGAIDAPPAIDAPAIDAPPATNVLGQLCPTMPGGGGMICQIGSACIFIEGIGSTTTGYCSPNCNGMNTICTTGYTGPAGGMPRCVLGMPNMTPIACGIVCTETAQCPTGLECMQAGAAMFCIPPA